MECLDKVIAEMAYSDYYDNPTFSDITVVVGNREIRCHKLILNKIPYFEALFRTTMKESTSQRVVLEEVETAHVEMMLKYAYGTLTLFLIPPEELIELYKGTQRFEWIIFLDAIWDTILDRKDMNGKTRASVISFGLNTDILTEVSAEDLTCDIMKELSFEDVQALHSLVGTSYWAIVLSWIAAHSQSTPKQHAELLKGLPCSVSMTRMQYVRLASYYVVQSEPLRTYVFYLGLNHILMPVLDTPTPYDVVHPFFVPAPNNEMLRSLLKRPAPQQLAEQPFKFPKFSTKQ